MTKSARQPNVPITRRAFCLSGLAAAGMAGAMADEKKPSRPPSVILIVLDTVRADHLGFAGYEHKTSPHLDAFAAVSTVYRQARSTSPWTLPSHVTLFTGQYSFQHHVEAAAEARPNDRLKILEPAVPDSATMLAETLKSAGYATAAFTANSGYMSAAWNFTQGFDTYVAKRSPGREMVPPIVDWLTSHAGPPLFLFVNFMDAHHPYNIQPCPGAFDEPVPQDPSLAKLLLRVTMGGSGPADKALVRNVTAQYDMGVANADCAAGRLVEALKQLNLFDDSLVIITSDHGEFIGEHMLARHSKEVYEQVLHVPLLVKLPGQQKGETEHRPVSLVQVCGTIQRVAGVLNPAAAQGLETSQALLAELNYSRSWDVNHAAWGHRFRRLRTAYYDFPFKLIHSSDGKHELYDLANDPAESKNLFDESRERAETLLARLNAIKPLSTNQNWPHLPPPNLSEEDRQELRANGYL